MLQWFRDRNLRMPNAICDNNEEKHGSYIEGIPVISFEEAFESFFNFEILITSTRYGNEIEKIVLKKLKKESVINLEFYFNHKEERSIKTQEFTDMLHRYAAWLRDENDDTFPLLMPEEVSKETKTVVEYLSECKALHKWNKDKELEVDNFYIKYDDIDFWQELLTFSSKSLKKMLSKNCFNGVYKFKDYNGHLIYHELMPVSLNFGSIILNICSFHDFLLKMNIPFLFLQFPNKLSTLERKLPANLIDEQNQITTLIVSGLRERGVSCFDYRETMKDEGVNSLDYFYLTDFHWTTEVAFKASEQICAEIERFTSLNLDKSKWSMENYERILYKDVFLGYNGIQSGILFSDVEEFELILPRYETDYSCSSNIKGFFKRGKAKEVLLAPVFLGGRYYEQISYLVYCLEGSDIKIINHKNPEGKKIVWLHDSFAMAMTTYLAPHFSELYFFDLRGKVKKKDIFECIERIKPDIVVMGYWPQNITSNQSLSNINPYVD